MGVWIIRMGVWINRMGVWLIRMGVWIRMGVCRLWVRHILHGLPEHGTSLAILTVQLHMDGRVHLSPYQAGKAIFEKSFAIQACQHQSYFST